MGIFNDISGSKQKHPLLPGKNHLTPRCAGSKHSPVFMRVCSLLPDDFRG